MAIPELELPFTRENIYARDEFTCQYCGKQFHSNELSLDHVYPKSRGGEDSWENLVTCCRKCNQKKADRTPEEARMPILCEPRKPKDYWGFEFSKVGDSDKTYWGEYYQKAS
jgi:5-methylcytosine-specific restriction endonuclease McrA